MFIVRMTSVIINAVCLGVILGAIVIALGGCGNTIKGIGTDIVKMGDKMMKEESKDVVSK
tara:strand:- start:548 stop:727 length:180 start_codon:yes stop_codon:yes gene_type:complete